MSVMTSIGQGRSTDPASAVKKKILDLKDKLEKKEEECEGLQKQIKEFEERDRNVSAFPVVMLG